MMHEKDWFDRHTYYTEPNKGCECNNMKKKLDTAISALNKIEKHIWLPHQITDRDDLHCEIHKALFVIKETLKQIQELREE